MDPITIGSLVAALAGTALQQQASQDAARRQQRIINDNLARQREFQVQAEQAALQRAQDFAPDERENRQQQIEQQVTEQLMQPVQQAMPGMQEQSSVQGNVSSDYSAGRARAQADTLRDADALARIMGKITGANRLRTNEALAMGETGQLIDRLKSFSQGGYNAAQADAQMAGTPSGGPMLAGGLLQGLGTLGFSGAIGKNGAGAGSGNAWAGSGVSPASNGVGLRVR